MFFLGSSLITWQSQKQRVVAHVATATTACQGTWLSRLLAELQGEEAGTFMLKIDNQSAIQLSRNPIFHDHSKHIDTKYHFIKRCVEEDRVKVEHVDTSN
jgi:hypothetical protein